MKKKIDGLKSSAKRLDNEIVSLDFDTGHVAKNNRIFVDDNRVDLCAEVYGEKISDVTDAKSKEETDLIRNIDVSTSEQSTHINETDQKRSQLNYRRKTDSYRQIDSYLDPRICQRDDGYDFSYRKKMKIKPARIKNIQ